MARTSPSRPHRVRGLFALALVVALASCGTSGETSDQGAGNTATSSPAPAGDGGSTSEPASTEDSTTETTDDTTTATADEPTDEPAADPADACSLLARADAEAAFGEPVADDADQYADECWWTTEGAGLKSVNLQIGQPDLEEWRAGHDNDSWEQIDLGDEAFVSVGPFSSVELRMGDTVYAVNVTYSTSGDPDAVALQFAELVASRLG